MTLMTNLLTFSLTLKQLFILVQSRKLIFSILELENKNSLSVWGPSIIYILYQKKWSCAVSMLFITCRHWWIGSTIPLRVWDESNPTEETIMLCILGFSSHRQKSCCVRFQVDLQNQLLEKQPQVPQICISTKKTRPKNWLPREITEIPLLEYCTYAQLHQLVV